MASREAQSLIVAHDGDKTRIAVRHAPGAAGRAGVMWLGGFRSVMTGGKASALAAWAGREGRACLRFDYSGHGASGGVFSDGTIGRWLAETRAVFEAFARGATVLAGSSMGGWLALLLALDLAKRPARQARAAGLFLIAPATDMTEALIWPSLSGAARREIATTGRFLRPSRYDPEPYEITARLIEEGRTHLLLDGPIALDMPVRILHGMADPDVPWRHGVRTAEALAGGDVEVTLVKDGDHRLSRARDIERLVDLVARLCARLDRAQ